MSFSKIASALVASALVLTPIAAQAGTRASGSPVYSTGSYFGNRTSANVKKENSIGPALLLVAVIVGGSITYVAVEQLSKS